MVREDGMGGVASLSSDFPRLDRGICRGLDSCISLSDYSGKLFSSEQDTRSRDQVAILFSYGQFRELNNQLAHLTHRLSLPTVKQYPPLASPGTAFAQA